MTYSSLKSLFGMTHIKILLFLLPLSSCQIIQSNNFNHNQPCVHVSQCNNKAGLYCIPSSGQLRCGCPTNNTTFDEYQGRCVGKVGHPCIYQGNESFCPEKAHCSHQDPHHPDLYYYESRCFCDVNYFGDKQGKCVLAAKFGESCSSSSKKCDEVSGLKCVDGKCTCAFGSDHQYYDQKRDKCVSFIGKKCSGFNSCVDNARCDYISVSRARAVGDSGANPGLLGISALTLASITRDLAPRSVNGNNASSKRNNAVDTGIAGAKSKSTENVEGVGKCVCEYGFTATKDGKCLAGYRQSCSKVQKCNPEDNLECLDGSCNCKSPLHQIYHHSLKKCLNLMGAKCDSSNPKNSCLENGHCVQGICVCKEGFSKTPFRLCMIDYNKPCENGQCNLYTGLSCKSSRSTTTNGRLSISTSTNKKCSCVDDSLVYNSEIQACVSQVGSPCGKIGQAGDYGKEFFHIACEPRAICTQDPGGDASTKFCRGQ